MVVTVVNSLGEIVTHTGITEILLIANGSKLLLNGTTDIIVRIIDVVKITSV